MRKSLQEQVEVHEEIAFLSQDDIDELESDNKPVEAKDLNDLEAAAVIEITNDPDVAHSTVDGRDFEGILVVTYTRTAASVGKPMPYEWLFVYDDGRIAEAGTNQPVRHRTFRELREDLAWQRGN